MPAPDKVHELVERFDYNLDSYRSGDYKEARVRSEFIDPMFKELGWDINNEQGYAEAYKDVVHEDALKIGVATKAPDYSFRIGGVRKFFLEAKKPAVNIKGGIEPAYQLRRYAWSAKLPLSLLTDFEELAVYDCRVQPNKDDKSSVARTMYLTYKDYLDNWDDIAAIFSREAILKGAFDKYADANKKRRGTTEVDDAFLDEIETWRRLLASNIAINNQELSQRELNAAVQKTIDRIIFLRITEDRGIEPYGALEDLTKGENVYRRLGGLFQSADDRYNSGLFHFSDERNRVGEPDTFTLQLTIDDKPLKDIIKSIYYPDSPYEFSVLSADILGQVYERFLGKVIRLDSDHQAIIEEKPEVKKAGGVYYTPTYIVDYIVENTVGKLAEGKTLDELSAANETPPLRVLDPACGSGTFLLGAYQYLLDWHLQWYVDNNPKKHAKGKRPSIYQDQQGAWRLSTDERKRILLTHIYGVDIDAQAVEVTKLSLLLKVLEGENNESLNQQSKLFKERVLPDLSENIKCGNSLIGSDFYQNVQPHLLGEEERYRINVFDWKDEFVEVFEDGGFDAVIGNPPWVSLTGKFGNDIYSHQEKEYLTSKFSANTYMPNVYEYFMNQGILLTKPKGYFSFIVPDRLGFNEQFVELRSRILSSLTVQLLMYKLPFPGITADTLMFSFRKAKPLAGHRTLISKYGHSEISVLQKELESIPGRKFEFYRSKEEFNVISKILNIGKVKLLGEVAKTTSGFGGKSTLITRQRKGNDQIEVVKGENIKRYSMDGEFYFEFKKQNITGRTTDKRKLGAKPKILLRKTGNKLMATYDDSGIFPEQSLYFVYEIDSQLSWRYLLGLLNSSLMQFYFVSKSLTNAESIAQVKKIDLDELPILVPDLQFDSDRLLFEDIAKAAESMVGFNHTLQRAKTSQDKKMYTRLIAQTDKQIDQKVYELYGLDDDDIAVVEGTLA